MTVDPEQIIAWPNGAFAHLAFDREGEDNVTLRVEYVAPPDEDESDA